jgi:hypothetical protein
MKTTHFCAHHKEQLKTCEHQAWRCWSDMMRRGVMAYSECRFESAEIYFSAALEIALLRYVHSKNEIFQNAHLIKSVEFVINLLRLDLRFDDANRLLKHLSASVSEISSSSSIELMEYIKDCFVTIEEAEKSYLIEANQFKVKDNNSFHVCKDGWVH